MVFFYKVIKYIYILAEFDNFFSFAGELTEGKPPIQVKFEIPYFTTSGIQVRQILKL